MLIKQHIPFDKAGYSFSFVEFEMEYDSPELAIAHNIQLVNSIGNEGLDASAWKKLKAHMLNTGEVDVNQLESLSKAQGYFVNELKKSMRELQTKE